MPFEFPSLRGLAHHTRSGLTVATCVLLAACSKAEAPKPPAMPPAEVRVAAVRVEQVPVVREYVGTVSAYRSVQIRARVEGILTRRAFVEGTDVKQGQLLYSIDPAPLEATLRDAQAALAQAEANVANARLKESRFAPLVKENAISKQDYDDAVTTLKQTEAAVLSARATVDRAKLNLGYTSIYATETGHIGSSLVPEGALVGRNESTLLTTIDKLDPIYVNFSMPDRDALSFQREFKSGALKQEQGEAARFILPDGTAYKQAGRIDFADAQVNRDTGTLTMRAVLPNKGSPAMLPGMFVRVVLTIGSRANTLLVPQQAVLKVPTGHVAFVVTTDNKIERRDLVVGDWIKDDWIIDKGLAAGDQVVVEGVQKVQPGMTVKPVPYAPAAKAAPGAVPAAAASAGVPATAAPAAASAKK